MGRPPKAAIPPDPTLPAARSRSPKSTAKVPAKRASAIPAPAKGRGKSKEIEPQATAPQLPAMTSDAAMAAVVADARQRQAAGKPLQNFHVRALRDAWLFDQQLHIWPSSAIAAADLGVSLSTFRGYADEGCPAIQPHEAIPKAPVYAWLLRRAHKQGGEVHKNRESIEDVEYRIKAVKAAAAEKTLIAEAEDRATQALLTVMGEVRESLLKDLPAQVADAARQAVDHATATEAVLELLVTALRTRQLPTTAANNPAAEQE